MHYPESLFGDNASLNTTGVITMDELHMAQKATPVVGVSAVNVTSAGSGGRSWGAGMRRFADNEGSVGSRMKRLITNKRGDSPPMVKDASGTASPGESLGTADDSESRVSRSATIVGEGVTIPGTFPSSAKLDGREGDAPAQAESSQQGSASDSEPKRQRPRRHTILGVFKRIFR
ncbi:hypothetical protein EC988_001526 [Linderina pennispora]|nr:hypothetical protein EC988_001526 [Linderina pennispora]